MKNYFLSVTALILSLQVTAQTLVVDLRTGIAADWYTYSSWDIPPGSADDTWSVKEPGGSTFLPVYSSTGHNWQYQNSNPYETYSSITPLVGVIARTIKHNNNSSMPWVIGDLFVATTTGNYTYRTQFNFDANCNMVNSAYLNINILSGGEEITDIKINGVSQFASIPSNYTSNTYGNYLKWADAINAPNGWSGLTFTTSIPAFQIQLNTSLFVNGNNEVTITSNATSNNLGAGILVDGDLTINYTPVTGAVAQIDLSGSSTYICGQSGGAIHVTEQTHPNDFTLKLTDPSVLINGGSLPNTKIINPATTTTYGVELTHTASGCKTSTTHNVVVENSSDINTEGTTYAICLPNSGYLSFAPPAGTNSNNYVFNVYDPANSLIYSGQGTAISISPGSSGQYKIVMTNSQQGCQLTTFVNITVSTPPCDNYRPTGISVQNKVADEISVSPNPGTGIFKINAIANENTRIEIYDASGKLVKEVKLNPASPSHTLDITGLPKGIYLLSVKTDGKIYSRKIALE